MRATGLEAVAALRWTRAAGCGEAFEMPRRMRARRISTTRGMRGMQGRQLRYNFGAMMIRPATTDDHAAIWTVLEPIIRQGETFALPRDMTAEAALAFWFAPGNDAFVAEDAGAVVGTYFLHPNQLGGGGHVANCGYATRVEQRGRGVARAMCAHSLAYARARGFRAMQFNMVVSTNERAVRLWQAMGFAIVGRLPGAFAHPTRGDVDALVMFQTL
jgi:ribosomal protein S18 acetylase RimI-like enzyme